MKLMATAKAQQIMSEPGDWEELVGIYSNYIDRSQVHREHWDTDDIDWHEDGHPIIVCHVSESLDLMALLNQPTPSEA